jgi:hypothetical protein
MKSARDLVRSPELIAVTAAALHDSFFPIQEAGEDIVEGFRLTQFLSDVEREAQDAPTVMKRESASKVLKQMTAQFRRLIAN